MRCQMKCRMRWMILTVLIFGTFGCGSINVQQLDLRDPRLPGEARRWLADAEDEVVIARAGVDNSQTDLAEIEAYRRNTIVRLEEGWATGKGAGAAEGEEAWGAFAKFVDQRVRLAELALKATISSLELAKMRLTQARAETAMRYDLAVYEISPIVYEMERLRDRVASSEKELEAQRVTVEKTADEVWRAFAVFAQKGGLTNALWGNPLN
jgi:hypothetical protein